MNLKILIVEDELIIAESIKQMLIKLNYNIIGIATDSQETKNILKKELPDLLLVDIQLNGGDDGILLAQFIKEKFKLPIIFITSHSDEPTVERAKNVRPDGYLVKPFEKQDLYTSIEIAFSNYLKSNTTQPQLNEENFFLREFLFVKKKYQFEKIRIQNIQWIKSDGNYLEVYCGDEKRYLIRSTFNEFFNHISLNTLFQVHKSYAVNFEHIETLRTNEIIIGKQSIPVGRAYRNEIKKRINIVY